MRGSLIPESGPYRHALLSGDGASIAAARQALALAILRVRRSHRRAAVNEALRHSDAYARLAGETGGHT